MEEFRFISEAIQINYFKRWSALNVKVLLIENSILATENENTASYLREYKNQILTNKNEEKKLLTP